MFEPSEISSLVQRMTLVLGNDSAKKITFIAARAQEGTSSIARSFAEGIADETGKKVLLIDAGALHQERFILDGVDPDNGIAGNFADDGGKPADAIHKIDHNLYLARWQGRNDSRNAGNKALHAQEFWQTLQDDFPMIVIDAPSLQSASDGISLAAVSDATIIVVEAEATRQPVLDNLQRTLESAGAKIAGTILNKRRQYIPDEVYANL